MHTLTVTLETVTPLFLGGADPRGAPELRAPPFRGAMRYWLRALTGAAGEQVMRQHEDHLFGAGGDQGAAGAINVRIVHQAGRRSLPQKSYTNLTGNQTGIAYSWFAARGTRKEPERSAIMPATFTLLLSAPRSKQPGHDLKQAEAVLWLLTRLGGIGARSRRFAGSVQVTETQPSPSAFSLPVRASSPQALAEEIANGIQAARQAFNIQTLAAPAPTEFDVLHPERCRVFVLNQTFSSWTQAVDAVGLVHQQFRHLRQPDYNTVKQAMTSGQDLKGPVERAAFGLPIPFFYRSLNNRTATLQAEQPVKGKKEKEKIDRRASPLWMRAVKLSNNQYAVVITWFKSQFLPANANLLLTERGQPDLHGSALPTDKLIATFLQGKNGQNSSSLADAGYGLLEVSLK